MINLGLLLPCTPLTVLLNNADGFVHQDVTDFSTPCSSKPLPSPKLEFYPFEHPIVFQRDGLDLGNRT